MSRNTVARIDLSALRHNLQVVRELACDSQVVCVIKADAYGHGLRRVARALAHTDVFAVATPEEAQIVRESGWAGRLLLLEGFTNVLGFELSRSLGLELVIHQPDQLELLKSRGCTQDQRLWVKIDSGMHRLGFPAADAATIIHEVSKIPGSADPVLMTHFACADEPLNSMTDAQIETFDTSIDGCSFEQSLANSAAILNFKDTCREYVRPGIMLYGISPNAGQTGLDHGLKPVMTLACELIAINQCRKGDRIGYGASYTCKQDIRVGVAAIGYGDGYPRHLHSGCPVLVNGHNARLVGRVSMDLITLDLSNIANARVGDEVVLWGEGLPVEEVAAWENSIPYELVCGVTGRVERAEV